MADKDWRSGTLLGAGYALVVNGAVLGVMTDKEGLRRVWERVQERSASAAAIPFTDRFVKQVCFILPPWEQPDAR